MAAAVDYDVIIVGAGMVGLSLACVLGDSALRVLIVDSQAISNTTHLRVSAINIASQRLFQNLSVWETIKKQGVSIFEHVHAWDSVKEGAIQFDANELAQPYLGHIIENDVIRLALYERAKTFSNIEWSVPARGESIRQTETGVTLTLEAGDSKTAQLLVGADGANSWVRKQSRVDMTVKPYQHTAIVATVTATQSHQKTAWQCFLPTGPLAHLPLQDEHQTSIVWSCVPEKAEELLTFNDEDFSLALARATQYRLGDINHTSERISFPLLMRHCKQYTLPGIALIGDAAHTIHPLAGLGVNLGLMDAAALGDIILAAKQKNKPIGQHGVLRRYERMRKSHNVSVSMAMAGFKRLFSGENQTLAWIRSTGLNVTNQITPLKAAFMRQAMGLSGDLPKLAK